MSEDKDTKIAVYRDALEAVTEIMPSPAEIQKQLTHLYNQYSQMISVSGIVRGALEDEGIERALDHVRKLEKMADLLAHENPQNPSQEAVTMAIDLAKEVMINEDSSI